MCRPGPQSLNSKGCAAFFTQSEAAVVEQSKFRCLSLLKRAGMMQMLLSARADGGAAQGGGTINSLFQSAESRRPHVQAIDVSEHYDPATGAYQIDLSRMQPPEGLPLRTIAAVRASAASVPPPGSLVAYTDRFRVYALKSNVRIMDHAHTSSVVVKHQAQVTDIHSAVVHQPGGQALFSTADAGGTVQVSCAVKTADGIQHRVLAVLRCGGAPADTLTKWHPCIPGQLFICREGKLFLVDLHSHGVPASAFGVDDRADGLPGGAEPAWLSASTVEIDLHNSEMLLDAGVSIAAFDCCSRERKLSSDHALGTDGSLASAAFDFGDCIIACAVGSSVVLLLGEGAGRPVAGYATITHSEAEAVHHVNLIRHDNDDADHGEVSTTFAVVCGSRTSGTLWITTLPVSTEGELVQPAEGGTVDIPADLTHRLDIRGMGQSDSHSSMSVLRSVGSDAYLFFTRGNVAAIVRAALHARVWTWLQLAVYDLHQTVVSAMVSPAYSGLLTDDPAALGKLVRSTEQLDIIVLQDAGAFWTQITPPTVSTASGGAGISAAATTTFPASTTTRSTSTHFALHTEPAPEILAPSIAASELAVEPSQTATPSRANTVAPFNPAPTIGLLGASSPAQRSEPQELNAELAASVIAVVEQQLQSGMSDIVADIETRVQTAVQTAVADAVSKVHGALKSTALTAFRDVFTSAVVPSFERATAEMARQFVGHLEGAANRVISTVRTATEDLPSALESAADTSRVAMAAAAELRAASAALKDTVVSSDRVRELELTLQQRQREVAELAADMRSMASEMRRMNELMAAHMAAQPAAAAVSAAPAPAAPASTAPVAPAAHASSSTGATMAPAQPQWAQPPTHVPAPVHPVAPSAPPANAAALLFAAASRAAATPARAPAPALTSPAPGTPSAMSPNPLVAMLMQSAASAPTTQTISTAALPVPPPQPAGDVQHRIASLLEQGRFREGIATAISTSDVAALRFVVLLSASNPQLGAHVSEATSGLDAFSRLCLIQRLSWLLKDVPVVDPDLHRYLGMLHDAAAPLSQPSFAASITPEFASQAPLVLQQVRQIVKDTADRAATAAAAQHSSPLLQTLAARARAVLALLG